jgi:hypothetical protein
MTTSIDLRCYCHGLGDCMLVKLPRADGSPFWMLFDCGIHSSAKGGSATMREVVEDIAKVTSGVIDVVVGTHEHWDHLSGFIQARKEFEGIEIREVWFSWAENPKDPDARKLDKYKGDAAAALAGAAMKLSEARALDDVADGVGELLGFVFGADGDKVRTAREALRSHPGVKIVRHLEPGTLAPLPEVPSMRAYVLGPPRDTHLLGIEDIVSETYAFGGSSLAVAPIANAVAVNDGSLRADDDPAAPFDGAAGRALDGLLAGDWPTSPDRDHSFFWKHYLGPDGDTSQDWRRIDYDWLTGAVDIALQLDGRTNNTSLVIALEIVETGRVLLFAADAQIGNWKSWDGIHFDPGNGRPATNTDDLIQRTVFYKVGHHGSRNATRATTLERMNSAMLVAFSPTDESLAVKVGWKDFPAPRTTDRIRELTNGRFFPSDADWIKDTSKSCPVIRGGALIDFRIEEGKYIDLTIG